MSSGGKGGSSAQSKNYYGTLAGAVCWGPLDWLTAIVHNGNYLFQGNLTLTQDVTDLTGSILDPELIASGGYLKIYRGTETQPADAALVNHPPYKGTVIIVAKNIFFGQNSGSAPNIQIIGGRLPRVPTSIVLAADNIVDDGQVNPVAALAEYFLDERGGGVPISSFDGPSWQAAAHWCAQDATHRNYTFCSPLLTEQAANRDVAKRLLDPFGGFIRWSPTGLLTCKIYEWGVDPGNLPILDASVWTKKPKLELGDWIDVPTELLVNFVDRAYEYQSNTLLVPNARAAQIRQVDDQQRIDRPDITRANQAHRNGTEVNRRLSTAPSTSKIKVRGPFIKDILVGDKIKVDTDPEPGGSELVQMCRVDKIEQDRTDEASITVTTDNLLPAEVYKPVYPVITPTAQVSPPLVNFLAVPLPPVAYGLPVSVGLLATRPSAAIVGFDAYVSDSHTNAFDHVGPQVGFAVRAQLASAIGTGDTTISLTELDGLNAPDASLAANTPGGNLTAAKNNTLLVLLAQIDGSGRIELNASGDPIMEFISVSDRTFVSGNTFSYSVLRGRNDTLAASWSAGAVAWIVPGSSIVPWQTSLLGALGGSPAFFRLVSYTSSVSDVTSPAPECSVNMLPATAPMVLRALSSAGANGMSNATVMLYQRAASAPAVPGSDLTYNFTTGAVTGTLGSWSTSVPASNGQPLYSTAALASTTGTSATIHPAAWATPIVLVQDGTSAAAGANTAQIFIFQRAASQPAAPSASTTYTFATSILSGLNNGWSQTVPTANGNPLWVTSAAAFATGATDTILSTEWAAVSKMAQDGVNGAQGPQGTQGTPGANGTNGQTSYFHVAYANSADGSIGFNQSSGAYVGTYVDYTAADSTNYLSYTWRQFVGSQGPAGNQGIPGSNGSNGQTSYLHIKYSNDGGSSFTGNGGEDAGLYIGTYVDYTSADSGSVGSYSWARFRGYDGSQGPQGNQGTPGANGSNGQTSYFHIAYANSADGSVGFNQSSGLYVGTYVDFTPTDSSNPAAYTWRQFVGSQGTNGTNGIAGNNGIDGQTSYLHIKYSNDGGATFTASSGETPGDFLGTYTDFTMADSTSVSSYTWARIKGVDGAAGTPGTPGTPGGTVLGSTTFGGSGPSGSTIGSLAISNPGGSRAITVLGSAYNPTPDVVYASLGFYRDGSWFFNLISNVSIPINSGAMVNIGATFMDTPTSGAHTYSVRININSGTGSCVVTNASMTIT